MRPGYDQVLYCPRVTQEEIDDPGRSFASAGERVEFIREFESRFLGSRLVSDTTIEILHHAVVDLAKLNAAQFSLNILAKAVHNPVDPARYRVDMLVRSSAKGAKRIQGFFGPSISELDKTLRLIGSEE